MTAILGLTNADSKAAKRIDPGADENVACITLARRHYLFSGQ
jgi:hypothetical protein